jgi:cytochrome c biogenesis protein CcmG/thiol:disulfide interchange protein DsbE
MFKKTLLLISALLLTLQASAAAADDQFDLKSHAGKVVIVDFWASWCVPCRRSFPWLNAMHRKYGEQGLVIIGVNLDAEKSAAKTFLEDFPPEFSIYYDETKELAREFGVVAMPSSYLIGRDGEIIKEHFGFKVKKQAEYESAIVDALLDTSRIPE